MTQEEYFEELQAARKRAVRHLGYLKSGLRVKVQGVDHTDRHASALQEIIEGYDRLLRTLGIS